MKILFLTSSPGYGHTRAAEALELAFRQRYPDMQSERLDVTDLFDPEVSEALQNAYLELTADHPELYQKLYDLDKGVYQQLAGTVPADQELIDFLLDQQRRWQADKGDQSRIPFSTTCQSLDSALVNTLISGICHRNKIPGSKLLLQGLLGLFYQILANRLKNHVLAFNPDLLIATQMYPNALLTRYVGKGVINKPVVGVLTDYGAHGLWLRDSTRLFCVSHESVANHLQQRGIGSDRIAVTGIPLMPAFENPPGREQARTRLGLDDAPTILVTGGQCGIGINDAVRQLVESHQHHYRVLVTAGRAPADAELTELAARHPERLILYSWSDDMVSLLRAADVVVGKPGGLTVSESLACGRPFIATCCLGGQERHNVEFLKTHQVGARIEPNELPALLDHWFSDPAALQAMQERAEACGRRQAARAVVAQVDVLLQESAVDNWQRQLVRE